MDQSIAEDGFTTIQMELNTVAAGIYLLQFVDGDGKGFVKQVMVR